MNQTAIGSYIARKRREQNLTQELERQKGILYGAALKGRADPVGMGQVPDL